MRWGNVPGFTFIVILFTIACGEKMDPLVDPDEVVSDVTYTSHIKRILDESCIGCHASYRVGEDRNNAPPGIDYDTSEAAQTYGPGGNSRIQADVMPPSTPLSVEAKNLFQEWIDDEMPL